jgi:CubicO group peptidase (beta-lactamase class C family)
VSPARDALAVLVTGEIAAGAMPGAAWWVGDGSATVSQGAAGHAAVEPHVDRVREDTPFDLASLTKPLATALLAAMLESERRIDLAAPLGSVFPVLRTSPFGSASLRDAATHRAGLPAWKPLYLAGATQDAYLAAIASCDPVAPAAIVYSDLGYVLLGFALERFGGAALDRLFEERVAGPLGLRRCGFAGRGGRFADAAATERGNLYERRLAGAAGASHHFRVDVIRGEVHDGNAWALGGIAGHAGLFGSAADVAAIACAMLEPRRLGLPPGALAPMFQTAPAVGGSRTFGFLAAAAAESVRGILADRAVGHFGFTGTSIWIDASGPRVYVFLTNRVHPVVPATEFTSTRRAFHTTAAKL